jgi:hypothetical protein
VVSPDNRSPMEINERIHGELQSRSTVGNAEYNIRTLVPRQGRPASRPRFARGIRGRRALTPASQPRLIIQLSGECHGFRMLAPDTTRPWQSYFYAITTGPKFLAPHLPQYLDRQLGK